MLFFYSTAFYLKAKTVLKLSLTQFLQKNEENIVRELNNAQGRAQDVKGYYLPDTETAFAAMRPSMTLNAIIDSI